LLLFIYISFGIINNYPLILREKIVPYTYIYGHIVLLLIYDDIWEKMVNSR